MINTLKKKFVILAMISLTLLLAAIVAGMNIINYNKVVSDADARLEVLEENSERFSGGFGGGPGDGFNGDLFGRGGRMGPRMSPDEAEESRFFTVLADSEGKAYRVNTDRISSVTEDEAESYAAKAMAADKDKGFIGDIRYSRTKSDSYTKITFLDCGRYLDSFRDFLKASILMSLAGLLTVFFVILYFAGRIVRPVAESYEKQKRFITDAGHEIKTPLAIIKANLDLINMEIEDKSALNEENLTEVKTDLAEISNQTDRLGNLTNDLVYLSRMEEKNDAVLSDVPLSDIASDGIASFDALARDKRIVLESNIEEAVFVKGNAAEVEKLISILLENAIKYSPEDSSVSVRMNKDGKYASMEVRNNTTEVQDKESLNHVFERFYRSDSSRNSATGGHGIGLSVASAIVKSYGGKIEARTTDGNDFIVSILLPLSESAV